MKKILPCVVEKIKPSNGLSIFHWLQYSLRGNSGLGFIFFLDLGVIAESKFGENRLFWIGFFGLTLFHFDNTKNKVSAQVYKYEKVFSGAGSCNSVNCTRVCTPGYMARCPGARQGVLGAIFFFKLRP